MAKLVTMPPIVLSPSELAKFGTTWTTNGSKLSRTPPFSSGQLGVLIDTEVGKALAKMLGGIPVVSPTNQKALTPPLPDCVEVGPVRIVGGVRPQNFDVGYRPDGVRFAFDSKTLNDYASVGKNWQNMVNDLSTEATTVHSRFPHAIVAFIFMCPEPSIGVKRRDAIIETLERMAKRVEVEDAAHKAEVASVILWDPATGDIDPDTPDKTSPLRIETFSEQVENVYVRRYKGLPPHAA